MGVRTNLHLATFIGLSACAVSGVASAAGFYIQEQSAAGVGRSQAGNVAASSDASTVYSNPAGMTQLPGLQLDQGIDLLVPDAGISDRGSVDHSPVAPNSFPGGGTGGNPGSATPIPDFYVSAQMPDVGLPIWVGLAVTAPFAFASKYNQDSFARYDSIDTFLETIDIAPTIAIKLNDWLSIGLGLDEQWAFVKLRSAVPDALAIGGPSIATDGRITITGHTWTTGFNGGLLITPNPDLKIGLTYRYGIQHQAHVDVKVANLTGLLALANQETSGSAALDLPDMVQAGFAYKLTPQWTLLGEFDFFTWSNFKQIAINTNSASLGNLVTAENYQDSYAFSIGAEYQLDSQWLLRTGFKYDQTPTQDAFRDTRVPDGDRYEIGLGFHYAYDDHIGIDAGYSHLFFQDSSINIQRPFFQTVPAIVTTAEIKAETHVNVDVLSVGLTYKF